MLTCRAKFFKVASLALGNSVNSVINTIDWKENLLLLLTSVSSNALVLFFSLFGLFSLVHRP